MALCAIVVTALVCDRVSSATGDKQLARVKGIVGYQDTATSEFRPIFGRLDLPDDAYAVTKQNGSAVLRLADSSEIDIGEKTIVQVGAFNAATSGNQNTIALNNGALHFVIRHPTGGQSNYKFVTATSQIAVRGTEGFLVAGLQGTQVVCVQCAAGDVTVQVGQQTISVLSNQTLTVLGSNPLTATSSLTSSTTVNNPAVNQFNNGSNPISGASGGNGFDPTSSFSGTGAGAGGGIGGGAIAGVAGGAGAAAAVAATTTKSSSTPSPTPAPVITPTPQPGPLVVSVNFPGANAVFPVPFSWPFSQTNATTQATVSCTPPSVATCTATQTLANGSLNGTVNGNLVGPGQFTFTGSASGVAPVSATFSVYGAVTSSVPTVSFTSLGSQSVTITQLPAGTSLSATVSCNSGAALSLASSSGLSPWNLSLQATAAPNTTPPPSVACTVTVTGQGGTSASTITIPVNITSTSIGVSTHVRKPL